MKDFFGLFNSPRAGPGSHVREGVKEHDIHIKPESYKFKFLKELVV